MITSTTTDYLLTTTDYLSTTTDYLSTATDYLEMARAMAARPNDWPFAPRFDPSQRWYRRLPSPQPSPEPEADAEAWLLTWLPGQGTDLHDHGDSAGAFVVITGTLTERVFDRTAADLTARTLTAGDGHRFGRHYVHEVLNTSDRPAISLHVYGPALKSMTRYRLLDGDLRAIATESAGVTW